MSLNSKSIIMKKNVLITGGAGFIGSHVVRRFLNNYPEYQIINLDKLTYAGNLENLRDIDQKPNYTFIRADICDFDTVLEIFNNYEEKCINNRRGWFHRISCGKKILEQLP